MSPRDSAPQRPLAGAWPDFPRRIANLDRLFRALAVQRDPAWINFTLAFCLQKDTAMKNISLSDLSNVTGGLFGLFGGGDTSNGAPGNNLVPRQGGQPESQPWFFGHNSRWNTFWHRPGQNGGMW